MKTNQVTLKHLMTQITSFSLWLLTFLMFLSCNSPSAYKPNSEEFTLFGESQSLNHIDVGHEGHSHGDIRIFEGSLRNEKNKKDVGSYTAMIETVSLPQDGRNPDQVHEDRFRTIIFEFDDGSTIIVMGISHFTVGETRLAMNDPRNAAIVGGTGKYIGARGQYTATRMSELLYEFKFEILY